MSDFFSYKPAAAPLPPAPSAATGAASQPAILADLSGDEWEQFISFAARRRYPAGAVIVQAGDTDRALCFIASGRVDLRGPGTESATRGEGEVFGLLSFLDGAASAVTASVSAGAPADLLRLTPEALQQLAAWQPRIAMALLRDLSALVASRLRRLQPGD